jgi:2'-5' RNA ligase
MTVETALLVPMLEVEPFVSNFRNKYDPSAIKGVPAHITILYPFKPPSEITPEVVQILSELFGAEMLFDVTFSRTGRFPEVLYFSPEPVETFQNLTQKVAGQFPDTPPYGGQFSEVIPHLTIAHVSDSEQLQEIEVAVDNAIKDHLPIRAQAKEVFLMDNESSTWQVRHRFSLKGHKKE